MELDNRLSAIRERLSIARKTAGLSQSQVAKMLDVTPVTVSRWETGERDVSLETLLQMADLYMASIPWIMTGENPKFDAQKIIDAIGPTAKITQDDIQSLLNLLEIIDR